MFKIAAGSDFIKPHALTMATKLIEFQNHENETLRGIMNIPQSDCKTGVIMLHGFEGAASTEIKSKFLADELAKTGVASLRLDFSGCGLSDGDLFDTTISKQSEEFKESIAVFRKKIGQADLNIFAHSLGACSVALAINDIGREIGKIVFMSPVLNQKDMLRYYFATNIMKIKDPQMKITWENYRQYLDEEAFLKDCARITKILRPSFDGQKYFMTSKDIDLSGVFKSYGERILCILGDQDPSAPMASISADFSNRIIVSGGDHHLEKTKSMRQQWLGKAMDFLRK